MLVDPYILTTKLFSTTRILLQQRECRATLIRGWRVGSKGGMFQSHDVTSYACIVFKHSSGHTRLPILSTYRPAGSSHNRNQTGKNPR